MVKLGEWPSLGFALLLATGISSTAFGKAWRGIEPGISSRDSVVSSFGQPTRVVTQEGGREVLAYYGKQAIAGTKQVQFRVDGASGLIERIDIFPLAVLDRQTIEETYGLPCARASRGVPCYTEKVGDDLRLYFSYTALDLAVFFKEDGKTVWSLVYHRKPRPGATTPKVSLESSSTRSNPPPVPGGASSAGPSSAPSTPSSAEADEWGGAKGFTTPAAELAPEKSTEINGKVRGEYFQAFREPSSGQISSRQDVDFWLRAKGKTGRGRAEGALIVRQDFADPSRNRFDANEAFVAYAGTRATLSAGKMLAAWGTGTLFNPSDILNPKDLRDPFHPEKLGSWMARGTLALGPALFEVYYLPVPSPSIFPSFGITDAGALSGTSPWIFGSLPQDAPVPLHYHLLPAAVPAPNPSNGQYAARVAINVLGIDMSAAYVYMYDHLPVIQTDVVPQMPPVGVDVYLNFAYKRLQVATFDFERAIGPIRVAGETAIFKSERLFVDDPEDTWASYVAGFDFQTPQFFEDHAIHVFLEFTDTRPLKGALRTDLIGRFRYPLRKMILGRVHYQVGNLLGFEVNGITSVERSDFLINPVFEVDLGEAVRARFGALILGGDPVAGFFGEYKLNSRAEATIEASF